MSTLPRPAPFGPRAGSGTPLAAWIALTVAGFRRFTAYPLAALAGVAANVTFGAIRAAVLLALAVAGGAAATGYDAGSLWTYTWLSQASIGPLAIWGTTELSDRVRTGDVAVDLARPVDPMFAYLAADLGRAGAAVVLRALPTLAAGALIAGIALPAEPLAWAAGALGIVLGVVLSFLARFALQLVSFWIVDTRGLQTLYMVVSGFFAGLVVPLPLMPDWLRAVALLTPFPAMLQYPVDVLSGRTTGPEVAAHLAAQVGWLAALLVLGRLMFAAGARRLVVQGG